MEKVEIEERGDLKVHGAPGHSMAVHKDFGKLVIAKKSSDKTIIDDVIEQYNILPGWMFVLEKVICPRNGGIECVIFVGEHILSTHLNGSVTIANPHNDIIKRTQLCATPLWSACAIDEHNAAIVTHSANLYCFNLEENIIKSTLNLGVGNRLFSVATRKSMFAIGASDSLFIVDGDRIKFNKAVPRKEKRLPTIVWSVIFIKDDVVASGDSRGIVTFWNTSNGVAIKSVESHQADILSLCSVDGVLWAAGVDPRIMSFKEVSTNNYQVVKKINGPVRDVKALVNYEGRIYASGDDHNIYVGENGCQIVRKQWNKEVLLATGLSVIRGNNYIDLYTSGKGEKHVEGKDEINVAVQPLYLARIYSPSKLPITACDVSVDGTLIAISSSESTSFYKINLKKKLKPITKLGIQSRPANAIKIFKDFAYLAYDDFEISRVPLDGTDSTVVVEQSGSGIVCQIDASSCGKHIAVLTSRSQLFAIDAIKGESRAVRAELPIDFCFNDADSLFVLTVAPGFDIPEEKKKILFEFPKAGGAAKRSISSASLFGTVGVRPLSVSAVPGDRVLVSAVDGQWAIIDKARGQVQLSTTTSKESTSIQFRPSSRVCCCRIEVPIPETKPFKLKKFGHQ
ncbi:unnamed protein product [Auanema sp. JU1783]|nr:unnamed protein product [Auanema sp. JU1783]